MKRISRIDQTRACRVSVLLGSLFAAFPHLAADAKTAAVKVAAARAPIVSVASFGGGVQEAQQSTLFAPFDTQEGIKVQLEGWNGALSTLQKRTATGSNDWDLVLMEAAPLQQACHQGIILSQPLIAVTEEPPASAPGINPPDSIGRDCGVEAFRTTLVLAWDKQRVDMTPGWGDFWDVARRPGKRGLRRDPQGTLEIALIADGVAPEDVYRTLATQEGVERAFRKLDQLKPYIVWWNTPAEAVQIIESGAVLMTSAPDGEVATANQAGHRSFGTQEAQSIGAFVDWGVPRSIAPEHRGPALKLLRYMLDPARRAAFDAAYPPGRRAQDVPAGKPSQPSLMMDEAFWDTHLAPLEQRFEAWIASR